MKNDEYRTIKEVPPKKEEGLRIEGVFEGLPYRGPVIHLKETDDISQVLKLNQKLHVARLVLEDPKDMAEYERICQEINDGRAQQSFEERVYIPETKNWVVLVRWIEWWYSPAGEQK